MLAAETAFDAVRARTTRPRRGFSGYEERIDSERRPARALPVRNVHQVFSHGLVPGMMYCRPVAGHRRLVAAGSDARRMPATSTSRSSRTTTEAADRTSTCRCARRRSTAS